MSTTWILVKDQRVQNVIVATPEVADAIRAKYDAVIAQTSGTVASIGDAYNTETGEFTAAPVPQTARTQLTKLEFRSRLTQQEKVDIYLAAEQDVNIRVWLADFAAAQNVDVTDQRLIQGLHMLAAADLIAESRIAQLLQPEQE